MVDIDYTKTANCYKEYVKNYKYVTMEMISLTKDQQCFLIDLLPLPPPIPGNAEIQHKE